MGDENIKENEEFNKIIKAVEEELGPTPIEDEKEENANIDKDDKKVKDAWAKLKAYGELMKRKREEEQKKKGREEDEER